MKPLLIIKTGSAFASLQSEFGDFDDFVLSQMPGIGNVLVATVFKRIWLPAYDTVSGVIITGSHAMVTDREDWSEFVAKWLRGIAANTLPVLGICYGHQLLAHAWGGDVGYHPQGKEIGTVGIDLTAAGCKDPLLSCMPRSFIFPCRAHSVALRSRIGFRCLVGLWVRGRRCIELLQQADRGENFSGNLSEPR